MNTLFPIESDAGAQFSDCRVWRYALWRTWNSEAGHVMFIGLNPSTADESKNDPTIRRCINFAKRWGYGGIHMLNLFAFRATQPVDMRAASDPIGPDTNNLLLQYAETSDKIICCWGAHGTFMDRGAVVAGLLSNYELKCLGCTSGGEPKHPLYLPSSTEPESFT